MITNLLIRTRNLASDRRGGVLVVAAAALPIMVGFAGLAVEVGTWYADKRDLQTAADAAALSGAFERVRGNPTGLQNAARYEAARNGFIDSEWSAITVNNPPQSGTKAGETTAVEVILTRPHSLLLSSLFLPADVSISARAVAAVEVTGEACVLALDRTANAAINNQGSTTVNMSGCVMAANSNSANAIQVSGSATVDAYSLWTVGDVYIGSPENVSLERPATTGAWELEDPWQDLEIQPFSGCTYTKKKFTSGDTATIGPGVYCDGLDIGGQSVITMEPGTYIINRGNFSVGAGATLTCSCPNPEDGVTIILTSSSGNGTIGQVDIQGGANIQLRAPSGESDPYRGIIIYQDRRALTSTTNANKLNGGATMSLAGGVYIPSQSVQFSGNNSATTCTQIVARTVTFIGNSTINNSGCKAAGVEPVTVTAARLAE